MLFLGSRFIEKPSWAMEKLHSCTAVNGNIYAVIIARCFEKLSMRLSQLLSSRSDITHNGVWSGMELEGLEI